MPTVPQGFIDWFEANPYRAAFVVTSPDKYLIFEVNGAPIEFPIVTTPR